MLCVSLETLSAQAVEETVPVGVGQEAGATPVVEPPVLQKEVPPVYPMAALQAFAEADIELLVSIGPDGKVLEALIADQGFTDTLGFGAAALDAMRSFEFKPATRDGVPMRARIRYKVRFRLPSFGEEAGVNEPTNEPDPTETPAVLLYGALEGKVIDVEPNTECTVRLTRVLPGDAEGSDDSETEQNNTWPEGTEAHEITALCSDFRFEELEPGWVKVEVIVGEVRLESEENILAGEVTSLRLRSRGQRVQSNSGYSATARITPPPREVSRRSVEGEVLTRIPGTRGDALRAVELLPGVGRPAFGLGALLVRGSAPGDSSVLLNGLTIPSIYHFGGITSVFSSALLDSIEFYPGNFSARYGRKMGGILEINPRDPKTDRFHGTVDLNVIDASALVETPIGPNVSVALAGRRSYIDFIFKNVVPTTSFNTLAAPVYYDYQLLTTWKPNRDHRVRLMIFGSSDEFALIFANASNGDSNIRGNLDLSTQFHKIQLEWRAKVLPNVEQDLRLSISQNNLRFSLGPELGLNLNSTPFQLRNEWTIKHSDALTVYAGVDMVWTPVELKFRGPPPGQAEGGARGMGANAGLASQDFSVKTNVYRPAAYVETVLKPVDELTMTFGVRSDYYKEIGRWSVDPRLNTSIDVTDRWKVRGGIGMYSQPPEFQESAVQVGNPNLRPIRAMHLGLGVDYKVKDENRKDVWSVSLDGFYKDLSDRVVFQQGIYSNTGIGRIYGLELAAKVMPQSPVYGFLSYTLSRSERKDGPTQNWRLFDFDQTHILTLAALWRIGDGWETGATFRLVTGNPFTPIVSNYYDVNQDVYRPVYGETNSQRSPYFHRLDLRVEKKWKIGEGGITVYLDVQNVYNERNREGVIYNYDYTQSNDLPGLPIIPSLGLKGEI